MADISNKALAILVGIAIVISLIGIFSAQKEVVYVTGAASQAGLVNFTIATNVSIKVTGVIDFGSGRVNPDANYAILDTHNDSGQAEVINGTWNPASFSRYLEIENDGTVRLNVTFYTDKTAASFIGGTNPSFMIKGIEFTGRYTGCDGTLQSTYVEVTGTNETTAQVICDNLDYDNTADRFNVSAKLRVPSDATTGTKTATLTFVGTQI